MRSSAVVALASFFVAVTACDLPLPEGVELACDPQGEPCPSGQRCADFGRCVDATPDDRSPPVVTATVDGLIDGRVGRSQTLRLTLTADEALAVDPVVIFAGAGVSADVRVAEDATDRDAHVFAFDVDFDLDDGVDERVDVSATVVDVIDNRATVGLDEEIVADSVPPSSTDLRLDGPRHSGAAIVFAGTLDDDTAIVDAAHLELTAPVASSTALSLPVPAPIGSFSLPATLPDGDIVVGVVEVSDAVGNRAVLRTDDVALDNAGPQGGSVVVADGASVVRAAEVQVVAAAEGAVSVCFGGDLAVVDDCAAPRPLLDGRFVLTLAAGEGLRRVDAQFFDAEGNVAVASDDVAVFFDGAVTVAPTLQLPAGQGAVKFGDVVSVAGSIEDGAVIVAAHVVDETGVEHDLADGALVADGSFVVGSFVVAFGAEELTLVVDAERAGVHSTPADSTSNTIAVDNVAPGAPLISVAPAALSARTREVTVSCASATRVVFAGAVVGSADLVGDRAVVDVSLDDSDTSDGRKAFAATCFDDADNAPAAANADFVFLADGRVDVSPVLVLPAGQSSTKPGDTLVVRGTIETGAAIESAVIVDDNGNRLSDGLVVSATDGVLSGSWLVPALLDGMTFVLEVIAVRDGVNSVGADSRSNRVVVDSRAARLVIGGALGSLSRQATLLAATSSTWCVEGDVASAATLCSTGARVAADAAIDLVLAGSADGVRTVRARIFDDGGNESAAAFDTIFLGDGVVDNAPVLTPPAGQSAIKLGDLVVISGFVEAGAAIDRAFITASDGSVVDVDLVVDAGGALDGSFVVESVDGPLTLTVEVSLVDRVASTTTAALVVDSLPPTPVCTVAGCVPCAGDDVCGTSLGIAVADAPLQNLRRQFSVAAASATAFCLTGDLDVVADAALACDDGARAALPSASFGVTLAAGADGLRRIGARFFDDANNVVGEAAPVIALVLNDGVIDAAPVLTLPATQTAAKPTDTIEVGGAVELSSTLVSAQLVASNGARVDVANITIDGDHFAGGFIVPPVVDGAAHLEVVVERSGVRSAVGASAPFVVDSERPRLSTFLVGNPINIGVARVQVAIANDSNGDPDVSADVVALDIAGDVVARRVARGSNGFAPIDVELAGASGPKTLLVTAIDRAGLTTLRALSVNLVLEAPAFVGALDPKGNSVPIALSNTARATVDGARSGDALRVRSRVDNAVIVREAHLVTTTAAGTCVPDTEVTVALTQLNAALASIDLVAPAGCGGRAVTAVAIEVTIESIVGVTATATSNTLYIDNAAPTASVTLLPEPDVRAGAQLGRRPAQSFTVAVADAHAATARVAGADVATATIDNVDVRTPFAFDRATRTLDVTFGPTAGPVAFATSVEDEVGNTTVVNATLALDATPPVPLLQTRLALVEEGSDNADNALIVTGSEVDDEFVSVVGRAQALIPLERAFVFLDGSVTSGAPDVVVTADAAGAFSTTLPSGPHTVVVVPVDDAGNRGPPSTLLRPRFAFAGLPAGIGAGTANFTVTSDVDVDVGSVLRVFHHRAGSVAALVTASADGTCSRSAARSLACTFTGNNSAPEGNGNSVLRFVLDSTSLRATHAAPVTSAIPPSIGTVASSRGRIKAGDSFRVDVGMAAEASGLSVARVTLAPSGLSTSLAPLSGPLSATTLAFNFVGAAAGAGAQTATVTLTDGAGNTSTKTQSSLVTLDLTPPTVSFALGNGRTNSTTVAGSAVDAGVGAGSVANIRVTVTDLSNNSVVADSTVFGASFSVAPLLVNTRDYRATAIATDDVGNVSAAVVRDFHFDNAAPAVVLARGVVDNVDTTPAFTATFNRAVDADEVLGDTECSVDGGDFLPCTQQGGGFSVGDARSGSVRVGVGAHTLAVRLLDTAGNVGPSSNTVSFTIDRRIEIATGDGNTCLRRTSDGAVFCMGDNRFQQVSSTDLDGVVETPVRMVLPSGTNTFNQVAVGGGVICVRSADRVFCRGNNDREQVAWFIPDSAATPNRPTVIAAFTDQNDGLRTFTSPSFSQFTATRLGTGLVDIVVGRGRICGRSSSFVSCVGAKFGASGNDRDGFSFESGNRNVQNPVRIGLGDDHICMQAGVQVNNTGPANPAIICKGDNSRGQLAQAATTGSSTSIIDTGITASQVIGLSTGARHTCLLSRARREIGCFGDSGRGQSGLAATTARTFNNTLVRATTVASAGERTCFIRLDGTVGCFGSASTGEGDNLRSLQVASNTFVDVSPLDNLNAAVVLDEGREYDDLVTGAGLTCGVLSNGDVRCFGDDGRGAFGLGATVPVVAPVAGFVRGSDSSSAGLRLVGGGRGLCLVGQSRNLTAPVSGQSQTVCAGDAVDGAFTFSTANISSPKFIAADEPVTLGARAGCRVLLGGAVSCGGRSGSALGRQVPSPAASGVEPFAGLQLRVALNTVQNLSAISMAMGADTTCAVDGADAFCAGVNRPFGAPADAGGAFVKIVPPFTSLAPVAVAVGPRHACATSTNGTFCWGDNDLGQLGVMTSTNQSTVNTQSQSASVLVQGVVFGGFGSSLQGLRATSGINGSFGPAQVDRENALAIGGATTCLLTDPGQFTSGVFCWGENRDGEIDGVVPTSQSRQQLPPSNAFFAVGGGSSPIPGRVFGLSATAGRVCAVVDTFDRSGDIVCQGRPVPNMVTVGGAARTFHLPDSIRTASAGARWMSVAAFDDTVCGVRARAFDGTGGPFVDVVCLSDGGGGVFGDGTAYREPTTLTALP